MSKLKGVIRVHPDGLNGKVLVFVKDKESFTEKAAKQAFAGSKKLSLTEMKKIKPEAPSRVQ